MDFVTALANAEATRGLDPMEYLGTLILLIVGGNDTTRNSISGGLVALNENPDEYQKLRDHPDLIPNMVSEIIRWQTPLPHMRRTGTRDTEIGGKKIRKGDKVVVWYVSANRDAWPSESACTSAWAVVSRRCSFASSGRSSWSASARSEVVGPPRRVRSNFVKGYSSLLVRAHRW